MTPPRDLLPGMEARPRKDGLVTYRYHQRGQKPVSLGTDRDTAIRAVLDRNLRSPDEGTVDQMWRLYKKSPAWARLASATHDDYTKSWGPLGKVFAAVHVTRIKPQHVARYLEVERNGMPRANREVALLSNLMKVALKRGIIERNPCREVSRNPEQARDRLVEREELTPFVEWALTQGPSAVVVISMAEFAALTGNRRAEFLNLHWPQVDDEIVRLQRAKGRGGRKKRELVAVSDALKIVLDRMRALPTYNPMGPVFAAPTTGNAYAESGFTTMWQRLMVDAMAAGVVKERFTFHDLRAHYTTYFKLRFGELPEMHADPGTTARVYERTREVKRRSL